MRFKFTVAALEKIATPTKGRTTVYDTEEAGLAMQVTPAGVRTFYVVKWHAGQMRWARLGSMEEMTIAQARDAAPEARSSIRNGVYPSAVKRQALAAGTLADMWETYRKAVVKRPRSMIEDEGLYTRYLAPSLGSKRLTEITEEATQKLYNRIAAGKLDREAKDSLGHATDQRG